LVKLFQPKVTLGNEKTQAPINVKDVQKASNRAKRIKCLEHQIKAAQVNVLNPKPRHSNHMKRLIAKAGVETRLSQTSSQHDWGSSKIIVHDSTLQNYVYPSPRSPSIDASQETEASKITNLDRSTEYPRANYARVCMATQRKKHMDTSISADESELFEAPSDIDASPRIAASISPIPAESRPVRYMKGRYIVPKALKKVRDEAQEAVTAALDQVPEPIHFDQRGKRTTATLYVGNLEFKASSKDLQDALDTVFR
jgi:hypothetical protein